MEEKLSVLRNTFRTIQAIREASRTGSPARGAPAELDSEALKSTLYSSDRLRFSHLDDLILRRTSLGDNPARALQIAPQLCNLFDRTEERCRKEVKCVAEHFPRVQFPSPPVDERM